MKFKKILITGSAGLLGRHVVRELMPHSHVIGFDLKKSDESIEQIVGSTTDFSAVLASCKDVDAVIHVAARPNIWSGTGEQILKDNVNGAWNVLQAAEEAKVKRVVLCSSDSVIGFTVMSGNLKRPEYLPIDTSHVLRPTDPYALSKQISETMGRSFFERGNIEIIALRPVFVLYEEMYGEVKARAKDPSNYKGPAVGGPSAAGGGPLWHYVDPRDVASAFRCALEVPVLPKFESLFVSASTTLAPNPTIERMSAFSNQAYEIRRPEIYKNNPYAPLYDLSETEKVIGFAPNYDLRHLLY